MRGKSRRGGHSLGPWRVGAYGCLCLWVATLLADCTDDADAPGGTTRGVPTNGPANGTGHAEAGVLDPRLEGVLEAHNEARAQVSPAASPALPAMTWADDLAAAAQAHAERCVFEHDGSRGSVGENLSVNAPVGVRNSRGVVTDWVAERNEYDYESNTCSDVCGHYTQVVWRDSTELGCGVATCPGIEGFGDSQGELWVCRYRGPGNVGSERPY